MGNVVWPVVVAGVDFSSSGDDALLTVLRMIAEGSLFEVHVLHVLDPRDVIDLPERPKMYTEELLLERAPDALRERGRQLAAMNGLRWEPSRLLVHVRIGPTVETLLQFGVDCEADLIIVGTHSRTGMERLMLGSVSEQLVRRARCPVLVARATDYAGAPKTALPEPAHSAPLTTASEGGF